MTKLEVATAKTALVMITWISLLLVLIFILSK